MSRGIGRALAHAGVILLASVLGRPALAGSASGYSGSSACRPCHAELFQAWSASDHAAAMRESNAGKQETTEGEGATFGKEGSGSVDLSSLSAPLAATIREPDLQPKILNAPYLLGRRPLEQLLVQTDRGRLQALPVALDAQKNEWFDVFSGDERLPGDFGHWTGRGMNANSQCIACHATDYRAGYDTDSDTYTSTWSEIGVGCEACHGPGAAHVADPKAPYGPFGASAGLAAHRPKPTAGSAAAGGGEPVPVAAAAMNDVCASCHSVRRPVAEGFEAGDELLDYFEPSLLDDEIYWSDGSVRTEAYEWGSYLQSRMHERGVNCLACHDVHSGELRAQGNELCLSCHEQKFADTGHTAHGKGTPASDCVSCHMPGSVFMARDHRRDHRLSVPDPLSAIETGAPSACESCHADRGREVLAAEAGRLWPALKAERHAARRAVAKAFADARQGKPESAAALRECLAGRTCTSPILRASAARLTERVPLDATTAAELAAALKDEDPLVRAVAAYALADVRPQASPLQGPLLAAAADSVRAVRINAAWALRTVDPLLLAKDEAGALSKATADWRQSTMLLADSPEAWHTLGIFETTQRDAEAAEAAYRKAIRLEPRNGPSRHNLAMLLIDVGRIDDARTELEALVAIDDTQAPAWYALGAVHGEQKNWSEAARALGRCLQLDPDYPGALADLTHSYLEAGVPNVARAVLQGALERPSARLEALIGLVQVAMKTGDKEAAARAAANLVAEDPSAAADPEVARLAAEAPPREAPAPQGPLPAGQ